VLSIVLSAASLIGATGLVHADTIVRYQCKVIGTQELDAVGDRAGHNIVTTQYSCFAVDGLMKGTVLTGTNIGEWDGPKQIYLSAIGVHRLAGGVAASRVTEGAGSAIMKDGKFAGAESSGTILVNFASGPLSAISGKTVKFSARVTGPQRFEFDWTD
jgi:hypothetical protein